MKNGSTYLLRFALFLLALGVLALCVFALPAMWKGGSEEFPMASQAVFLIMIGIYITALPFFFAVWQTFNLLRYIDQNKAFSMLSVKALRNIKYNAIVIAVFYTAFVPLLFPIADADDAPGLIVIGMAIACAPMVVAVFAAVLQKLVQNAIEIKSENDLTV
ncbi:MAG: DUF2975 domain-containing protein [Patescibacteria group bacterium]|jgi:hypothetical protein